MPEPTSQITTDNRLEKVVTPWWLWPQILSLDAPVVIVLWQMALAHTHRIHLPAPFYWGLGLVTWVVYVLDRTADALSGRLTPPLSTRHAFYLHHRRWVLAAFLPIGLAAMVWMALWHLPAGLIWQGVAMSMLGVTYLACFSAGPSTALHRTLVGAAMVAGAVLVSRLPLGPEVKLATAAVLCGTLAFAATGRLDPRWRALMPKEVVAAILIALGSSVGVHFWAADSHPTFCAEVYLLASLCLLNLLGIAASEHLARLHGDPESLVRKRPSLTTLHPWFVGLLFVVSLGLSIQTMLAGQTPGLAATSLAVACSSLLLGCLHRYVRRLSPELYHLLADVAMVLPLPVLFWLMPG